MHDSFSKKMQTSNMDLKVIWRLKKVKESDLKIVKGELKQFFSNFYFQIINRWKKMTEDGLAWQYRRVTRGGSSPLPFFTNWKKVPDLWEKMP